MSALLVAEVDFQCKVEQHKQNLQNLKHFTVKKAFECIDTYGNGCIDERALRRFFKLVGHEPVKGELMTIMRRFD
jgi:Ca2+-binding EF-hand superfamily protein